VVAPAEFGGLERVVASLVIGQRGRGHSVRVLCMVDRGRDTSHPLVAQFRAQGIDVTAVALPPRAYRAERRATRELLTRFVPNLVHTHGARVDVLDLPVARDAGFPTVTTVHGFTGGGLKNRLYEVLQRRAMRRADAVVAVSASLAAELVTAGVRPDRVHTLPNAWTGGEKPLTRERARARLGIADIDGLVIGWVGRLTREKGADVFIEAFAQLPDTRTIAVVVGGGPERKPLERLAARRGIDGRVRWIGPVERAEDLHTAFDVFVMSSRTEGTPIVLFEAIAAGVPVIVTAVGGIPDVVSPNEAMLVHADDPGGLADAIHRTLANPVATRARAVAASDRLRSDHAAASWLDRYDTIYRRVCENRATRGDVNG
jgi:glycosyltransferase involved in cell wall biosynthesis